MTEIWPIRKAIFVLALSIGITLLVGLGARFEYKRFRESRRSDERYKIVSIVQTGPEKEALKTVYLAELLGLSVDASSNLYAFHPQEAIKALLSSPLIASAQVKRVPPGTIYVDYEVRKPIAWLADYKNTAIDRQGFLFPVAPFFSPQEMPEIYLGLPPFGKSEGGSWRAPLTGQYLELAFALLRLFEDSPWKEGLRIQRIDVSNAFAPSLGRREIVLFTEEAIAIPRGDEQITFTFPKILRLAPKDYTQQLANFLSLRKSMLQDYRKQLASVAEGTKFSPRIVDLRVAQLAFVEN